MDISLLPDPALDAETRLKTALSAASDGNLNWAALDRLAKTVSAPLDDEVTAQTFSYLLPASKLRGPGDKPALADVAVPLRYFVWPGPADKTIICLGGIANSGRRFDFLGKALSGRYQVVALDWAGRGESGWLPEMDDYHAEGHAWQVEQLIDHLGVTPFAIVGSSLGGATLLHLHQKRPELVRRVIFNDFGPFIPKERRKRRSIAVAKHYVFSEPSSIFRRMGAAEKNSGPVGDAVLLHHAYHLTRWSDVDNGRVYRHDLRALLAFRQQAETDLRLWHLWSNFAVPLLVLHG